MIDELHYWTIAEAARNLKTGTLSPVTLVETLLDRIEALNPQLDAFVTLTSARALDMAKQAEAEREKRSKVIHAEGELLASQRLADAAEIIQSQPAALQLRYLQTLSEIATENSSTTIFPIPIDILRPFYEKLKEDPKGVEGG